MIGPRIAVTGPARGGHASWLGFRYLLRRLGAMPERVVPGHEPGALEGISGLVVGGGVDIGHDVLEQPVPEPHRTPRRLDPARDELELRAIGWAVERDLPVLGVCRGAQLLNVFFGGTLAHGVDRQRRGLSRLPTPLPTWRAHVRPGSRLSELLPQTVRINRLHRHAVERPGEGLRIVAWDPAGIPQAIEGEADHPWLLGVQWHPELLVASKAQRRLMAGFVGAASR